MPDGLFVSARRRRSASARALLALFTVAGIAAPVARSSDCISPSSVLQLRSRVPLEHQHMPAWLEKDGFLFAIENRDEWPTARLRVYDRSDPEELVLVSSKELSVSDPLMAVTIGDDLVFTSSYYSNWGFCDGWLHVVDCSDPYLLGVEAVEHLTDEAFPTGFWCQDGIGFVNMDETCVGEPHKIWMYDLSDPLNPVFISKLESESFYQLIDLEYSHPYVYMSVGTDGLVTMDISEPTAPFVTHLLDTPFNAFGLTLNGPFMYLGDSNGGLKTLSLSDPATPVIVETLGVPTSGHMFISGDKAWLGSGGLRLLDLSKPAEPKVMGRWNAYPGVSTFIPMDDELLVVAIGNPGDYPSGLFRVTPPFGTPLTPRRYISIDGWDLATSVTGDQTWLLAPGNARRLLWARHDDGVISESGLINFAIQPEWVETDGDHAYVACGTGGLSVISLPQFGPPSVVSTVAFTGSLKALELDPPFLYVTGTSGSYVVDVTQPDFPVVLGQFHTSAGTAITSNEQFLCVSSGDYRIFDRTQPATPVLVSVVGTAQSPPGRADLQGSLLYTTNTTSPGHFGIYDLTTPTPTLLASRSALAEVSDVLVVGNFAYVGYFLQWGAGGVDVYDVHDPSNPRLVTMVSAGVGGKRLSMIGETIAILGSQEPIGLLDPFCSTTDAPEVLTTRSELSVLPNPAPRGAAVTLVGAISIDSVELFDVQGRRQSLVDAAWRSEADGSRGELSLVGLSPGRYFIRAKGRFGMQDASLLIVR